jgi:hypothetical protein
MTCAPPPRRAGMQAPGPGRVIWHLYFWLLVLIVSTAVLACAVLNEPCAGLCCLIARKMLSWRLGAQ